MRPETRRRIEAELARVLGRAVAILRPRPLGGGSIAETVALETDAGVFVAKLYSGREAGGMLAAEALGLRALRAADGGLVVPEVLGVAETEPAYLLMSYLAPAARARDFEERLGRGLAALHRTSGPGFGFEADNFCGATPQPNPWSERWVEFYARHRLGFQVERAARAGRLASEPRRRLERFIEALPARIDEPPEGPALIHGDLWSGNVVVNEAGAPGLVDPAAYFAHREAELGMMTLFGGFSERVFAAYDEAFPLEPGWRERNAIYQLYHLLNHLNLFGSGYLGSVMSIVTA